MMEPAEGSCFAQHRTGNDWKPKNCSHALVSIANVPQLSADESVWFYFKDKSSNTEGYIRAVRNKNFMGRWVTSLPGNVGATIEFKGLIVPIGHDPNKHGVDDGRIRWEFDGPNRSLETKTLAVTQIEKNYVWGDALGQTSDPF